MDVFIDPDSDVGLSNQIYEQIRGGIVEGRLGAGDRLPATRELATTLGVSRHTVTTAFGRLSAEGYLEGRRGGGTVVSDLFVAGADRSDVLESVPSSPPVDGDRPRYDLRAGTPDRRLFPATEWKRYLRWAVDRHDGRYADPAGVAELRLVLARWIGRSRGVDAGFRRLVVTSGAQQALYLLARAVAGPGDVVAVEDPGYPPLRQALESIGAVVAAVPVDDQGIVVEAIPTEARLVYVTPSHQFPTGVTMSITRRMALLAMAQRYRMVVLEDDYDSEYRYVDRPLEPLFRLDRHGLVAYVATFSKILSPALRLGFAVVPSGLVGDVIELRRVVDWSPPVLDQLALHGFVADGRLDRHLRRARRVYQDRHRQVSRTLARAAARGVLAAPTSNAGLHVAARLADGDRERMILDRLAGRGIALEGFGAYSAGPAPGGGLVVGFGTIGEPALGEALGILEEVLDDTR